jgi:hypothetical protein
MSTQTRRATPASRRTTSSFAMTEPRRVLYHPPVSVNPRPPATTPTLCSPTPPRASNLPGPRRPCALRRRGRLPGMARLEPQHDLGSLGRPANRLPRLSPRRARPAGFTDPAPVVIHDLTTPADMIEIDDQLDSSTDTWVDYGTTPAACQTRTTPRR